MDNKITLKFEELTPKQALDLVAAYSLIKEGIGVLVNGNESPTQAADNAPAAAPLTGPETVTANQDTDGMPMLDKRGVPFHEEFHYPRTKEDGSWVLRRNHDKAARERYEAPFVGQHPAPAAAAPGEPAASAEFGGAPSTDAPATPSATFEAPAVRYLPSVEEYDAKWKQLCREQKVTGEHQAFIEKTFGGHPLNPVVMNVEENRRQIWVVFLNWEAGVKGF